MPDKSTETFKRAKDRRKAAPVKRIAVSADARKTYEEFMQARDKREEEHVRFLPDEHKGKR